MIYRALNMYPHRFTNIDIFHTILKKILSRKIGCTLRKVATLTDL